MVRFRGATHHRLLIPHHDRADESAGKKPSETRNCKLRCALRSDDTDAPSGVASDPMAAGLPFMLHTLFAAERPSPSARERVPGRPAPPAAIRDRRPLAVRCPSYLATEPADGIPPDAPDVRAARPRRRSPDRPRD